MNRLLAFDWCDFCENNSLSVSRRVKCDKCTQKYDEKPSEFKEDASVTFYRKTMEEEKWQNQQ